MDQPTIVGVLPTLSMTPASGTETDGSDSFQTPRGMSEEENEETLEVCLALLFSFSIL